MIEPFKIVNDDGSTNQSEYKRCITFLNNYIAGTIKVYPKLLWSNPVEIDMSQQKSALRILNELYNNYLNTNKLLTKEAFDSIKKLFAGLLDRYGSSIHTYGRYLEASKDFVDGPGYMYDVILDKDTEVLKDKINNNITIYYLNDENHTVLEYNDTKYAELVQPETYPTTNYPQLNNYSDNRNLESNVTGKPYLYSGNICGIYSDFQRLSGQYVGSPTLFYYSQCKDSLYTSGANSYDDSRISEIVNFNYKASVSSRSIPTQGIDSGIITEVQDMIEDVQEPNAFIAPELINPTINYLNPTFFTSKDETIWKI